MHAVRALIVGLCALGAAGAGAPAQDAPPSALGRDTLVRDDPRTPLVRVEIGWDGGFVAQRWNPVRVLITGGERPVGGVVEIEHSGMGAGSVRVAHPYGVAPGSTTPIEVMVPAGGSIDRLVVTVTDERGTPLRRVALADWMQSSLQAPPTWWDLVMVGAAGESTASLAASSWAAAPLGEEGTDAPSTRAIRIAPRAARALPIEWMGFDALDALIVSGAALDEAPEASVRAARAWVERGGRIVIVASGAGEGWRRWLPAGLVELGEMRDSGDRARREMSISEGAAAAGWRARAPDESLAADLADGPVGLGWAVVIGGDPAGRGASGEQAAASWGAALTPLLLDRLERASAGVDAYWWSARSPGVDAALDAVVTDLGADVGVQVWPVLLGLALLGAAIGPLDWFVLKRARLRHRSWATALGWIALASGLAYALPLATMSTGTVARTIAVEDGVAGMSTTARSAALGVLPGSGGAAAFDGAMASWWRPVSAGWNEPRFQGSMAIAQGPGDALGAAPRSVTLRVRSLRTLQEEGDAPAPARVTVRRADGGYEVTVGGNAPKGGALLSPEGWWTLERADDGSFRTTEGPEDSVPSEWALLGERESTPWRSGPRSQDRLSSPGAALGFEAAQRRWALLERRVSRGGWCVVLLEHEDAPARVGLSGAPGALERRVARIAAPIEDAEGAR